ncbi:class I SAM-dependent methyltransferase [Qipengyuania sediminis]|uniref:class I SAM-dependent methyltransferase n=1 Tax=Qipengyuania sediminis TaxID=1532023 RepID=UPI00105A6D0C|nr:class I SAM-dependent methyltransferase [Qipengyuania sediminis]
MSNPGNWVHKIRLLRQLGIEPGTRVLDYGCGAGAAVRSLAAGGFDAYGFDVSDYQDEASNRVTIAPSGRLPYPNGHFDMIFSDQVFEHAANQDEVFAELARITRPGGVQVHVIPAKWQLIEPHVHVPLGGLVRLRWWYRLWALLGVRNPFQKGLGSEEVVRLNWDYCRHELNYVSTFHYRRLWKKLGLHARFVEREYMSLSGKPLIRRLASLTAIPGVLALIRTFWVRIVVLQKAC